MSRLKWLTLTLVLALVVSTTGAAFAAPADASFTCTQHHTVQRGETLYRLSRIYGTPVSHLQQINGLGNSTRIYAGTVVCVSVQVAQPTTYIVQRGDTLMRIARAFGIDWRVLAQVNNLFDPNRITTGMVLVIPDFTIQ
ncbi:MAG: LysM peptidoglycan-binding domain-containing protein [Chloroflexi bacterium]|nr:LysM peptidoglycan-binding domain-containing protein [Chloroflexota bacterium]